MEPLPLAERGKGRKGERIYYLSERRYARCGIHFGLPEGVDVDKIEASWDSDSPPSKNSRSAKGREEDCDKNEVNGPDRVP